MKMLKLVPALMLAAAPLALSSAQAKKPDCVKDYNDAIRRCLQDPNTAQICTIVAGDALDICAANG